MLRSLRSLSLVLAVASLLAPAVANAASKKKPVYPTISSISPRKLMIGEKLTIKGAHLSAGKTKSSVAFYRPGKPVVFVKADSATSTKLVVTVSTKVGALLAQREGTGVATQLRLRVVATKMSKSWTKNSRSPVVTPLPGPAGAPPAAPGSAAAAQQAAALAYKTCQEQAAAAPAADADTDGIANGTELQYKLDPCTADTDGDTLVDGYEFWSAIDLNGSAVPYPGQRPWPNPLDPTDINYDFDGDGLRLWQENKLWKAAGAHLPAGVLQRRHPEHRRLAAGHHAGAAVPRPRRRRQPHRRRARLRRRRPLQHRRVQLPRHPDVVEQHRLGHHAARNRHHLHGEAVLHPRLLRSRSGRSRQRWRRHPGWRRRPGQRRLVELHRDAAEPSPDRLPRASVQPLPARPPRSRRAAATSRSAARCGRPGTRSATRPRAACATRPSRLLGRGSGGPIIRRDVLADPAMADHYVGHRSSVRGRHPRHSLRTGTVHRRPAGSLGHQPDQLSARGRRISPPAAVVLPPTRATC